MRRETQKRTFSGKALNVALAVVLAVGLMPPIHAFGEEVSGGQPPEQLTAGQDAPAVEEAQEPAAGEGSSAAEDGQAQAENPEAPVAEAAEAAGPDPVGEEAADKEDPADKGEGAGKESPAAEDPAAKKDAADKKDADEEKPAPMPAFKESAEVDGVKITVAAAEGTFPEGCTLQASAVPDAGESASAEGAPTEPAAGENVALSYTFDIKVLDKDGKVIQPAEGKKVAVSFSAPQVADPNLGTRVYHESDELPVATVGDAATAVSEGFSLYTVEFTYGELTYEMDGDATVPLADVLAHVGLVGEPTAVSVSNPELFSASKETGQWAVTAHKAFSSTEWMRVTIAGVEYEITVTDAQTIAGSNVTWELSSDGKTLTIGGTGPMPRFPRADYTPWDSNCSSIKTVVIGSGVTSIEEYAFSRCTSLTSVTIPGSVTSISANAFCYYGSPISIADGSDLSGVRYIGGNNDKLNIPREGSGTGRVSIRRAKDDAVATSENTFAGQLLYATLVDGEGQAADDSGVLYYWTSSVAGQEGLGGYIGTDTTNQETGGGSGYPGGPFYAATGYGYAAAAGKGQAATVTCTAYRYENGKLVQVGQDSVAVKAAAGSTGESSELADTLSGLHVLLLKGETGGLTVQKLLGRAGVTHIDCYNVNISDSVTSGNTGVATVSGTGKSALVKPTGSYGTADITYGITTGANCFYHGAQSLSGRQITVNVVGAEAEAYSDAIVLQLEGLPTGDGASTVCTISDGSHTSIPVAVNSEGKGTVTFEGLTPSTQYQVLIEVADARSVTDKYKAQATTALTTAEAGHDLPRAEAPVITGQPAGLAWTYGDATARTLSVTVAEPTDGGALSYQWFKKGPNDSDFAAVENATSSSYTVPSGTTTDAGECQYHCVVTNTTSKGSRSTTSDDATVTVSPKEVGLSWGTTSLTYSGEEQAPTATATGVLDGDTCTVTVTGGQTNAGENYTATASELSNANYALPTAKTTSFTISKADITPSVTLEGWTYGDGACTPEVDENMGGGAVTYQYKARGAADGAYADGAPSLPGDYTVRATVAATDNYNGASATADFSIAKRAIKITAESWDKVYDGVEISWDKYNIEGRGNVNKNEDGTVTLEAGDKLFDVKVEGSRKDAGTSYNVPSAAVIVKVTAGGDVHVEDRYDIEYVNGFLTVDPKEVGLSWGATSLTYNGKEQAPTATATGLVEGDECAVAVSGAKKDVGTNYTAEATGLSNKNYKLPDEKTTTFSIGQKEVGLSWAGTELPYSGGPQKPTATATGLADGDECAVTVEVEGQEQAPTAAGSYTAKATGLSNPNYKLPSAVEQGFKIVPADKGGLKDAVEEAEQCLEIIEDDDEDYGDAPEKLKEAIKQAKETLGKDNPTQGELDEAEKELRQALEEAKKDVDDTKKAKEVEEEIGKLPAAADVTADDKDAIESARKAYDALTEAQKAKVSPDALKKLEADEAAVKDAKIVYTVVKGAGSSWTKGSTEGDVFAFKRNVNDEKTIDTFAGVKVDGAEVAKDSYTAVAGSVVVTLSPAYLETLSVGDHKLTAMFADADDVAVDFKVLEAPSKGSSASSKSTSAKTGDALPIALIAAVAMLSFAVLLVSRTRTRKPVRGKHGH